MVVATQRCLRVVGMEKRLNLDLSQRRGRECVSTQRRGAVRERIVAEDDAVRQRDRMPSMNRNPFFHK